MDKKLDKNFLIIYSYSGFELITLSELNISIRKLRNNSSPGNDKIHNLHLKNLPSSYLNILLDLVNGCIKYGLPNDLKAANITMIPKKTRLID